MTVLIYGAGSVGLGIASCLLVAGTDVKIVARTATASALRSKGIRRTGIFGEESHEPGRFSVADGLEPFLDKPPDYVLLCTKSFDTEYAGRDLSRLYNPSRAYPRFVLFQNGWGNREVFSRFVPADRVFNARVITGFTKSAPERVEITVHAEDIHIGSFERGRTEEMRPLCAAIREGGVPCSTTDTIIEDLWAKMLYNCSLNSLGAVLEATYGELAENTHSRELLDVIISECFVVMAKSRFNTHWNSPESYKEVFFGSLVPATKNHYPSTLQDLRAGKKTEIDALNGSVIALAAKCGVASPYNRMVYDMVKYKEHS